jgi:hypothetical protein
MGTGLDVLALPSTPEAAAIAREHLRVLGSSWPPEVIDVVLLAASELAADASRYRLGACAVVGDHGSSPSEAAESPGSA